MGKALVTVGVTENNYSAYIHIGDGIAVATGKTFEEMRVQMEEAVAFHLDGMREDGEIIPSIFHGNYALAYQFDPESLLLHYNGIFTHAALEKLTGINQRQLQRYASGVSTPREAQAKKIQDALHQLGRELLAVEL